MAATMGITMPITVATPMASGVSKRLMVKFVKF